MDKAFFIVNKGKQLVYTLHLYSNKVSLSVDVPQQAYAISQIKIKSVFLLYVLLFIFIHIMLMTCFDKLSSIALTDGVFFIANKDKQLVYILHLYLNKFNSTVQEDLLKDRSTTFHLLNNNLTTYNLRL